MKVIRLICLAFLALSTTACHHIANDYDRYLKNAAGQRTLPSSELESSYSLSEKTMEHKFKFRSFTAGIAHLWIVEFGHMLEKSLESEDVQAAFGRLTKQTAEPVAGENLLIFDLEDYEFSNFSAHVSMKITAMNGTGEIFSRRYHTVGQRQGGKVFWGGAFAMKNAIQQSTHYAINDILTDFIEDMNEQAMTEVKTTAAEKVTPVPVTPAAPL